MSSNRNLIPSLTEGNGELVLEFFATFSRFECALKRAHFVKEGAHGSANPDWTKFADKLDGQLVAIADPDFIEARSYLLTSPPQTQKVNAGASMGWKWMPNDPQRTESNERYLLRLVRDVRNNLFHGGKYPTGPVDGEALRNSKLLKACLTILDRCQSLDASVSQFFEEAS
jgi:hypothetical protein